MIWIERCGPLDADQTIRIRRRRRDDTASGREQEFIAGRAFCSRRVQSSRQRAAGRGSEAALAVSSRLRDTETRAPEGGEWRVEGDGRQAAGGS